MKVNKDVLKKCVIWGFLFWYGGFLLLESKFPKIVPEDESDDKESE